MTKPLHLIANAVIVEKDHILLVKHEDFTLLPGGPVEQGAAAVLALQTAVCEAWDVELNITSFMGCFEFLCDDTDNALHHELNFLFKAESKDLTFPNFPDFPDANIYLEWCHLDLLHTINLQPPRLDEVLPIVLGENNKNSWFSNVDIEEE